MNKSQCFRILIGALAGSLCVLQSHADERRFTYTYEPEVMPQGAAEFEQWATLRSQRSAAVGQNNYNLWEFNEELEYGVSDNYSVSLYLNGQNESYRDPATGADFSQFTFTGVSIENRYMVLNPANHAVGLTLYLEPRFSGEEAEVEERIILGQRWGRWKWAFNLTHAAEWANQLHTTEGEVEGDFGLVRDLTPHWSLGFELREHSELPDYRRWENTALFLGPVVSYRQEKWWAALTVMPQIYGANFIGEPTGSGYLDLRDHERIDVRFIVGVSF